MFNDPVPQYLLIKQCRLNRIESVVASVDGMILKLKPHTVVGLVQETLKLVHKDSK